MQFFAYLGMGLAAYLAFGLLWGVFFVVTHMALFFSAGFRWRAMGFSVLTSAVAWPLSLPWWGMGGREAAIKEDMRKRRLMEGHHLKSMRLALRRGPWYRDVLGTHRKWLVDPFGREYDPTALEAEIYPEDYPCRNGAWKEGPCPTCGAPEIGSSVCGLERTEFASTPQYTPEARPMRTAPDEGFVLATDGALFHAVRFDRSLSVNVTGKPDAPAGGWVDREGRIVKGLHGWWPVPRIRRSQVVSNADGAQPWEEHGKDRPEGRIFGEHTGPWPLSKSQPSWHEKADRVPLEQVDWE